MAGAALIVACALYAACCAADLTKNTPRKPH
jgi:hypothetical protein